MCTVEAELQSYSLCHPVVDLHPFELPLQETAQIDLGIRLVVDMRGRSKVLQYTGNKVLFGIQPVTGNGDSLTTLRHSVLNYCADVTLFSKKVSGKCLVFVAHQESQGNPR